MSIDHEYQPHPSTGRCTHHDCPSLRAMGGCSWCGHARRQHTGTPPPEVAEHYAIRQDGKVVGSKVKWSTSACSFPHCACKKYER